MSQQTVSLADLPRLKRAYDQALSRKKDSFTMLLHDGTEGEFLTSYAKYMIEYFEMELRRRGNRA